MPKTSIPLETRLWNRVTKTNICWLWNGGCSSDGYGCITTTRPEHRSIRVHRLAFELAYGVIPDGMVVCHACDDPLCVRNDDEGWYEINGVLRPQRGHLWIGTPAENSADMANKGRSAIGDYNGSRIHPDHLLRGDQHPARIRPERLARGERHGSRTHPERMPHGESHGNAKLTAAYVREMRARYAAGEHNLQVFADECGITKDHARDVIQRKSWKHVV